MVPEADKQDTYLQLDQMRAEIETTRQQILTLELDAITAEKEALKKLAMRSFQQARQWTGRMLGELGIANPYSNGSDPTTSLIDPTTVRSDPSRPDTMGMTPVQQIKAARAHVKELSAKLELLMKQVTPDSNFTQFLYQTQNHLLQAGMWLGELLAEHFAEQPKADPEAVAPEKDSSPSTSLPTEEPSTATPTSGSDSEPTSPSASEPSGSEPALLEVESASELLTADAKTETSAKSVRK